MVPLVNSKESDQLIERDVEKYLAERHMMTHFKDDEDEGDDDDAADGNIDDEF